MAEFLSSVWAVLLFGVAVIWVAKSVNMWRYEVRLGDKRFGLPPGDMGWPLIGTMWSFLAAFKSTSPDSFISSFSTRFRNVGIYKTVMFGNPSIIVTKAEACRRVLTDDECFKPGWPVSTTSLLGKKSFIGAISPEDHRRLRKLTAAPVNGHVALSIYLKYIEHNIKAALEKWSKMGQIEFLTQVRKLTFNIIVHIFLSGQSEQVKEDLEREYAYLNHGLRAMAINLPGFAFCNALKARKRLVAIIKSVVTARRAVREDDLMSEKNDMLDLLLDAEDEKCRRLDDEEIIDLLIMYLNAGHESSAHICMWATIFLQNNPEVMQRAKAEQEEIVRNRLQNQEGLTLKEVRKMYYLSKVIDETLRLVTVSLMAFREAKNDVNISGYTIPKGWKVIVWFRSLHFDTQVYNEPKKFDPDRWAGFTRKAGNFLPFGLGNRFCPGSDLAKLEVAIFLHYFLLNYELERDDPSCTIMYIPHPRPKDKCLGRIRKI